MKPMSKHNAASAWQKWQPQRFTSSEPEAETLPLEQPLPEQPLTPTIDAQQEIEAFRAKVQQQAWEEGYAAGKAEGERDGQALGTEQGAEHARQQQAHVLAQIEQRVAQLTLSFDLLEEAVSHRLVQVALEVAHQLIGEEVSHDARMVVTQVKQLLANESLLSGTLTLHINPQDQQLLQGQLTSLAEHPRWEVVVDSTLPPGDCRLTSEEGELESALSHRWQALCEFAQQGSD